MLPMLAARCTHVAGVVLLLVVLAAGQTPPDTPPAITPVPTPAPTPKPPPTFPAQPTAFSVEVELTNAFRNDTIAFMEYYDAAKNYSRIDTHSVDFKSGARGGNVKKTETAVANLGAERVYNWTRTGDGSDCGIGSSHTRFHYILSPSQLISLDGLSQKAQYVGENRSSARGIRTEWWMISDYEQKTDRFTLHLASAYWGFAWTGWAFRANKGTTRLLLEMHLEGSITIHAHTPTGAVTRTIRISDVFTFTNFQVGVPKNAFDLPESCGVKDLADDNISPAPLPVTPEPLPPLLNPMPTLPTAFTAVIETNMREQSRTFTGVETFAEPGKFARFDTTVYNPVTGDGTTYSIFVVGSMQLAFQGAEQFNKQTGASSTECIKAVFNRDLIATVSDLFLVSTEQEPMYMGETTVRGVRARYWQTMLPRYTVRWFFSIPDWRFHHEGSEVLLRIEVKGDGIPPLFPSHPFLQKAAPGDLPPDMLYAACMTFADKDVRQCRENTGYFHHVHDIVDFDFNVNNTVFDLPQRCFDSGANIVSFPAAQNCPESMSRLSLFVLCVMVGAFGATAGIIGMYLRMYRLVKKAALHGNAVAAAAAEAPPRPGGQSTYQPYALAVERPREAPQSVTSPTPTSAPTSAPPADTVPSKPVAAPQPATNQPQQSPPPAAAAAVAATAVVAGGGLATAAALDGGFGQAAPGPAPTSSPQHDALNGAAEASRQIGGQALNSAATLHGDATAHAGAMKQQGAQQAQGLAKAAMFGDPRKLKQQAMGSAAAMQQQAADSANQMKATAQAQAAQLQEQVQSTEQFQQADQMRQQAQAQALAMKEDGQQRAAQLQQQATEEAGKLAFQAMTNPNQLKQSAMQSAQGLGANAQAQAQGAAQGAMAQAQALKAQAQQMQQPAAGAAADAAAPASGGTFAPPTAGGGGGTFAPPKFGGTFRPK